MHTPDEKALPAGEGAALGYFSPAALTTVDSIDYSFALRRVARAVATMAIILGGSHCVTFLSEHGGLQHQPYDWPWTHSGLVAQVNGWGGVATDVSGPLLLLGGVLTVKRQRGGLAALTAGSAALLFAMVVALLEVTIFQPTWNPLRNGMATLSMLFWQVGQLLPSLFMMVIVTRSAVRKEITASIIERSAV